MKLKIIVSLLILTNSAFYVNAEEKNIDGDGFWLGFGSGIGFPNSAKFNEYPGNKKVLSPKVELGYDFNDSFGIYSSYDYMHNLVSEKLHFGILGIKGNMPLTSNLSIFGKLGATYIYAGESDIFKTDNLSGTAGVGFEYQLTHAVTAKLGYDYYDRLNTKNSDISLSQVYWGMSYKFGQSETPLTVRNEVPVEVIKEVPVKVEVVKLKNTRSTYILPYQSGKTHIDNYARFNLNEIADTMRNNTDIKVSVIGRTDSTGTSQTNNRVSRERAENVAQYLMDLGIKAERITVFSAGSELPLTGHKDALLERSVQIVLE